MQGSGEGLRLARLAVFVAEEATVAAGEDDGCGAQPAGHRHGGTAGHDLLGFLAHSDDDPGRRCLQGGEVTKLPFCRPRLA